jgi:predicted RNA-binding Zn-ribbon protein involved in translation (DUF1610 family)
MTIDYADGGSTEIWGGRDHFVLYDEDTLFTCPKCGARTTPANEDSSGTVMIEHCTHCNHNIQFCED